MQDIKDILSNSDKKTSIAIKKRWRWLVTREIKKFVKEKIKASKFRNIKPSGIYFGTRSIKKSDGIQIFGTKPNAGLIVGFSAPVNDRIQSDKVYYFKDDKGWHSTRKKQKYADSLGSGIKNADVSYIGTNARPDGNYFGIKRKRKVFAYGLVKGPESALPVYADESIPDWIMEEHGDEIDSIVRTCGELAIEQIMS